MGTNLFSVLHILLKKMAKKKMNLHFNNERESRCSYCGGKKKTEIHFVNHQHLARTTAETSKHTSYISKVSQMS